jgi:hypothetical protein
LPSRFQDKNNPLTAAMPPHQLAAAAAPDQPIRELIGNFGDFESLFGQLAEPVMIELGKPLPRKKFLPKKRAGSCPAAHNRALLGDKSS